VRFLSETLATRGIEIANHNNNLASHRQALHFLQSAYRLDATQFKTRINLAKALLLVAQDAELSSEVLSNIRQAQHLLCGLIDGGQNEPEIVATFRQAQRVERKRQGSISQESWQESINALMQLNSRIGTRDTERATLMKDEIHRLLMQLNSPDGSLDPDSSGLLAALGPATELDQLVAEAHLATQQGDHSRALAMWEQIVTMRPDDSTFRSSCIAAVVANSGQLLGRQRRLEAQRLVATWLNRYQHAPRLVQQKETIDLYIDLLGPGPDEL
jgi:tetratricopeptide (TPR) repeat protein